MSAPNSNTCRNCESTSESSFQYCPVCGQKVTDTRITLSAVWSEFKDAVFNIESRTWRTLKSLLVPGKLTQAYISGKRQSYVHPLRVLIVTSIVAVIAMNYQDFQSTTNHSFDVKERITQNYERKHLYDIMDEITTATNEIYPGEQTKEMMDTIMTSLNDSLRNILMMKENYRFGDKYGDSTDLNFYLSLSDQREVIAKRDFLFMDEDQLLAKYKINAGFIDRILFKQRAKFIKDESRLFATLIGQTTTAILLMMPCLALILYLLYYRRNYYYVEHLIFTFHLQSFVFLVFAFLIAGMNIIPNWLIGLLILGIFVYLFLSIRKVYTQSLGKTIVKFILISVSYAALLFALFISSVVITFILL